MPAQTKAQLDAKILEATQRVRRNQLRLNQLNARAAKKERTNRTRRLILAGAVVLAKCEEDTKFKATIRALLDFALTADRDRAAFDLAPLTDGKKQTLIT